MSLKATPAEGIVVRKITRSETHRKTLTDVTQKNNSFATGIINERPPSSNQERWVVPRETPIHRLIKTWHS